tara:strand:- start:133 stop:297 length:165 start_codon:yes stop_codon:yes gene_type:complete
MNTKVKYLKQSYLNRLIKQYPNIVSGRKNYKFFFQRIKKNINLTRKYFKNKNLL